MRMGQGWRASTGGTSCKGAGGTRLEVMAFPSLDSHQVVDSTPVTYSCYSLVQLLKNGLLLVATDLHLEKGNNSTVIYWGYTWLQGCMCGGSAGDREAGIGRINYWA
jgi:hypothetical protein